MTKRVSPEEDPSVKGADLFRRWAGRWSYGHDKRSGRPFFLIPGSDPGDTWFADQNDCTCPDRQYRRRVCKHMVAVRLWFSAYVAGEIRVPLVTRSDRRAMLTAQAESYALDLAEQADSLLELYETLTAQIEEAQVDEPYEPSQAGRPVWLEPGDVWEADTRVPAPVQRESTARAALAQPVSEPDDPRDAARHRRQEASHIELRGRRPRLSPAPTQLPTSLLRSYEDLFPPERDER